MMSLYPYIPIIELPTPYEQMIEQIEQEGEQEYKVFKANIKAIQKDIKRMGKQMYLNQRKANRRSATAAYNESFRQVKKTFGKMKKNVDSNHAVTKAFKKRVFRRLKEKPGNVGFEIAASKNRINLIELLDTLPVPTRVKGVRRSERDRVRLRIGRKKIKADKKYFIANKRTNRSTGSYYTGVFFKKPGKEFPISASRNSLANTLSKRDVYDSILQQSISAAAKIKWF